MAEVEEEKPLTAAAILALVEAAVAQVVLGRLAQMPNQRRLMQGATEETQRYKVHHGQVEPTVIRWEVVAARVVEPATRQKAMAMVGAPNMAVEAEGVEAVPLILLMPMMKNRAALVFTVLVAAEVAVLERAVLVKI